MARDAKCTEAVAVLTNLFPRRWIEETAREVGWLRRRRKVSPFALFWTVVVGFGCGRERNLAGLRRAYQRETRTRLVPSSFYDRFTPAFGMLLRRALEHALAEIGTRSAHLGEAVRFVRDIVAVDSTVLRLHATLARAFPGARTNHSPAAAKLHVTTSVLGRGPRSVKLTDGRRADGKVRFIGAWVRDHLLLFDLGYYSFQAFSCIARNGGWFITRLKEGANPTVVSVLSGAATDVVRGGASLQQVLALARRDVIDVEVELAFKRRCYGGARRGARQTFRVVAVRNPTTREYHVYVTNVPGEALSAEHVAATYRGRWAIELLFKELKSQYRLADLPSASPHIVEALITASLLTLLVSQELLRAVAKSLTDGDVRRLRPLRWSRVVAAHAPVLLALILAPSRLGARARAAWFAAFKAEAIDPNVRRRNLLDNLLAIHATTVA